MVLWVEDLGMGYERGAFVRVMLVATERLHLELAFEDSSLYVRYFR